MKDTTKTIAGAAARFFSGTMLSRITGMMRDVAMAYAFGAGSSVAALLMAFRFAHLLRRLFGEGALQTAFIPHFEELRNQDPMRAGKFFCDLALSLTLFLTLFITGVMIFLKFFLPWFQLSEGNAEIAWLTFLLMPSLLFICLFGINASLLQCEKMYFAPSAAPVAFNLVWTAGIFCIAYTEVTYAMMYLAGFIVVACFAQWVITLPKTIAILKSFQTPFSLRTCCLFSKDVQLLAKPLMLGIVGVSASQINNAFDSVFARWADSEGPAFLWYAIRLQQLPLALFGIALSGALLPPLSRAIKSCDHLLFQRFLGFTLHRSLILMIPITALFFLMGDSCINFIFGRGDFDSLAVVETTKALWGYALGLVPMALILIVAPAFYAKGDYRTPSIAATASMGLNIGLNAALVGWFNQGAASVAIATSISAWFNLVWLGIVLSRQEGLIISNNLLLNFCKITIATVVAATATLTLEISIRGNASFLELINGFIPDYPRTFFLQLENLAINATIFICLLIAALLILKVKEKPTEKTEAIVA